MKNNFLTIAFLLFSVALGFAQEKKPLEIWDELLQEHVSEEGLVDYNAFQKDEKKLQLFLDFLAEEKPIDAWSVEQKMAFYINAYNAFTVNLIIENYPVESIQKITTSAEDPFSAEVFPLSGKKVSLNDIEKGKLIPLDDPRIHFAINCASISCPKLLNEAFNAEELEKQLENLTTEFINSDKNKITSKEVKLSKIFDWYKDDFETLKTSFIDFINCYSTQKISEKNKIGFLEYDWSLNEKH